MREEDAAPDYSLQIKDSVIMGSVIFNAEKSNFIDIGVVVKLEKPIVWLFEYMPKIIEKHGTSIFSEEGIEEIIWILLADCIDTDKPNRILKKIVDAIEIDSRIVSTPTAQIGIQYIKSLILMRKGQYKSSKKQLEIALDLCTSNVLEAISVNELSENVDWFWPAFDYWWLTEERYGEPLNLYGIGLKIYAYLCIERLEHSSVQEFMEGMRFFEKEMNLPVGNFWFGRDLEGGDFLADEQIFHQIIKDKNKLTHSILDSLFLSYVRVTKHDDEIPYSDFFEYFEIIATHVINFVDKALEHAHWKSKWNWIEQCCFLVSRCATLSIKLEVQKVKPNPPFLRSTRWLDTDLRINLLNDFRDMLAKHRPEEWYYDDEIAKRLWACTLALNNLYGHHDTKKALTLDFWPHQTFEAERYRREIPENQYYAMDLGGNFPNWWEQTFVFGVKNHPDSSLFIQKWKKESLFKRKNDVIIPWRNE